MHFQDREQAGRLLTEALASYKNRKDVLVAALPRGGVVLGRVVAEALGAPLDVVVPRTIPAPENFHYAVGAIAEDGTVFWSPGEKERIDKRHLKKAMRIEGKEAKRRLTHYRSGKRRLSLKNKTVILVDDGIATGLRMKAAIQSVKAGSPKKIVVAVPVAPTGTDDELRPLTNDVVILSLVPHFGTISAHYQKYRHIHDHDVVKIMQA